MALLVLLFLTMTSGKAQTAQTLSQVKRVYVEPFGREDAGNKLRERVIEQLQKKGNFQVVGSANEADAVIKGDCSIWVTGYVSNDLHSPSNARQPVWSGFLSAEIIGKANEPLWSYLVTPSKFRVGSITQDLADRLVKKLVEDQKGGGEAAAASPAGAAHGVTMLTAAGATFPAPLYQKWFESFQQSRADTRLAYRAVGSEEGIRLLMEGKVDFAGSDMPLSNESEAQSNISVLHFPTVLGAVVPIYNLNGVNRSLKFTPEALAAIFLGKTTKWNDAKIRGGNRGVDLPDSDIVVVHRSDGSGTTFVWTDYLSKVSPDWKASVGSGTRVPWPVGVAAEGNDGVAAMVQKTPNSIGYVELVYALRHQLSFGAVRNAAGQFIQADLASLTAAASEAADTMTPDFRVSITNASGKEVYPIASFTWWLVPKELESGKRAAEVELLQWILTTGQRDCSALGYAPLPRGIAARELELVGALK